MERATIQPVKSDGQRLSVIVVVLAGREYLIRCLYALRRQSPVAPREVIVPCDDSLRDVQALQSEFPEVRFVRLAGLHTYAQLRALGFREARGGIIALTEDHCSPEPNWCATIGELHGGPFAAVGGSVDKRGHDTALNWAIYLSDFGRYMNPVPEGPAGYLTDCNVSYKRSVLEPIRKLWSEEFHETTVNWELLGQGKKLLLSPRVVVRQQRSLTWSYALRERYSFGRLFASTRVARVDPARRLVYAGASFLLPAVLIGRVLKNVAAKRRELGAFARALPAILLVSVVWAAGEFVGYLTGNAGKQAEANPERAVARQALT
jgi:Glycosyl transferase family 2